MIKQQKFGLAIAIVTILLTLGVASFVGGRQLGHSEAVSSFMATFPNAVRRDIQAKLRDFVNAEDFGASQTANDNTAAINNAVAAVSSNVAGGGCIRFNAGTYRIAGTIVLPSGSDFVATFDPKRTMERSTFSCWELEVVVRF